MDIFWVFILAFGIIVSIGQKASKKQAAADEEGEPMPMSEQEMERRIRELLEGKQSPSKPIPQPTTIAPRTQASKPHAPQKQNLAASRNITTTTKQVSSIKHKAEPIKQTEIKESEIGQIVEDFTIEKAIIYSEIMNPKYKEY